MFYYLYKGTHLIASSMPPQRNIQNYQEITKEEYDKLEKERAVEGAE